MSGFAIFGLVTLSLGVPSTLRSRSPPYCGTCQAQVDHRERRSFHMGLKRACQYDATKAAKRAVFR
jgi:hypothetical protein